jgi:hypothetical protein
MSDRKPEIIDAEVTPTPASQRQVVGYTPPPKQLPASPFDVPQQDFKAMVQQRGENYAHLVSWLIDHMVPGEDVIQVHVTKRASCSYGGPPPYGQCGPTICPEHWSDPDLSKKGAEKVCGLLGIGSRFLGMEDFRKAALMGRKIEHVIVDCEIYNDRATLSQGTGACSMSEVYDNLNSAMKKACKRAHVDAVKRCAGLSGLATEIKKRMPPPDIEAAAAAAGRQQQRGSGGYSGGGSASPRYTTGGKLEVCPIGKQHKGKRWREIPTDYLEYIVREWTNKPDIVAAASAELSLRKARGSSSTSTQGSPNTSDKPQAAQQPARGDDEPPEWMDDDIPY